MCISQCGWFERQRVAGVIWLSILDATGPHREGVASAESEGTKLVEQNSAGVHLAPP